MSKLSIILPCYQVEANIPVTTKVLFATEELYKGQADFEYIFVDDGSTDNTLEELKKVQRAKGRQVKIIKLSRNFGANAAAMAGLHQSTGDCMSFLAADLQDPPELIAQMFEHWLKGYKLVVCNRAAREEGLSRRITASIYHFMMRYMVPTAVPKGGFDLILFDRQLRDILVKTNEKNSYIPYLVMWLGFNYVSIPYTRRKREIGSSMWTLSKKIKSAIDSVVSFSYAPVRLISSMGFIMGLVAMIYLGMVIYNKLSGGAAADGWSSLMVVVLATAAFQMISLGVIGEYVWRNLDSTRKRPSFIVDEVIEQPQATLLRSEDSSTG